VSREQDPRYSLDEIVEAWIDRRETRREGFGLGQIGGAMRLSGMPFGMHAGYLPGYPASHGCIRMPKDKAALFFKNVNIGTPVRILTN